MGVDLAPIIPRKEIGLEDLRGRTIAIDGNGELYQFLALIRMPDGTLLEDSRGNVTSHLVGLFYRTARLMSGYGIRPVYVFDGPPPRLKEKEVQKRREFRERAAREYEAAVAAGDKALAFAKAVLASRVSLSMLEDSKRLLGLLGIPVVQAPGEGEAQAAYMAARGDAWAVGSRDYDAVLFGAPRQVRFLAATERESGRGARPLRLELIEAEKAFSRLGISLGQLVDVAILIGTDFNAGMKGVGPRTALRLIKEYGSIGGLPEEMKTKISGDYEEVREIFLSPAVTDDYSLKYGAPDKEGIREFLCGERDFSRQRVESALKRLKDHA